MSSVSEPLINLEQVALSDKAILQQMLQLYQYDFSEFEGSDLNHHGLFEYRYLDLYWVESGRTPFFIRVNGLLAGFVFVSKHTLLIKEGWCLAEFFVLRKFRRQRIGKAAAFAAFDRFRGTWEVRQTKENLPAQSFWKKTVESYTNGSYATHPKGHGDWTGPILVFDNASSDKSSLTKPL